MTLQAHPIESLEDVETLRCIRNTCRAGFAHDNSEISEQAQSAWWVVMRGRVKGWFYRYDDEIVGYGLVRLCEDGRWFNSLAVLPKRRGQGYGSMIADDLLDRAGTAVWAEARLDNPAAVRIHGLDRWDCLGQDEIYAYFRSKV